MEQLDGFRRRLEDRFHGLTKSQRRIATYLLSNYDGVAFLPAADLARRLEVSEATVVRCAKALGFKGYPELRRSMQELLSSKVTHAIRLQRKLADLKDGHVLPRVVQMEIQFLGEALQSVSLTDFDRAVDILLGARRIFAFGLGPARVLPELVEIRLRRFGIPTIALVESGRDLLEKLVMLERHDAVVATAFFRVTPEVLAVLDHARAVGSRTVLVTDTLHLTLKNRAEVILAARRGPISTFHSLTVPMTIINALVLAVAMARPQQATATLKKLDALRVSTGLDVLGRGSEGQDRTRRRRVP
ncbi:MAG: MurR/RpiR family transcriptional regulator [Armatimonadota bacterium]|nr:MurR/RpiR family transcriptional regulator [Armatimonadota bacterium]MDR7471276.1 MurR/RpiR family transcriptional regulator [Armatimonadota bacterium]